MGRSDEALDQFVGDIIILGQKLTGDVKGHRFRTMFFNGVAQAICGFGNGGFPANLFAVDFGFKQAKIALGLGHDGVDQRRPLGADAPKVGGVVGIAADSPSVTGWRNDQATANTAIGAGCFDLIPHGAIQLAVRSGQPAPCRQ